MNVQILGISSANPFSQKTFADSLNLPYPLLSDFPGLKVIRSYGVVRPGREGGVGGALRHFFLVDTQGVVRGKWPGEDLEVFPSEQILKAARALQGKS